MKRIFKNLTVLLISILTVGVTALTASSCFGGSQGGDEIASQGTTNEDGSTAYYITVHYNRSGSYNGWNFYAWGDSDGFSTPWTGSDSYGMYVSQPLSAYFKSFDPENSKLGFIIRYSDERSEWSAKDGTDSDRFINFSRISPNSSNVYHVYLKGNDKNLYSDASGTIVCDVNYAYLSSRGNTITVNTNANMDSYTIYEGDEVLGTQTFTGSVSTNSIFTIPSGHEIDVTKPYRVDITFSAGDFLSYPVSLTKWYQTSTFTEEYNYDGELGAIYTSQHTIFRVWAPTSQEVKLRLYQNGTPTSEDEELGDDTYKEYIMDRKEQGVFEIDIWDDLSGVYYTYVVTNANYKNKEIVDPYAKSTGVNGKRGMVVDFDSDQAKPEGWDDISVIPYDKKELVVYETHVADVTSSSTWTGTEEYRKTFKGMAESGTTYTEGNTTVTTGFDNIKELGVNAVQILPFFDQANDEIETSFNWGYNPVNYNALEGSYSTNPYDGYTRIKEFRELVMAYNEAGINIIMDVVYNHMASANEANFDVLVPGYYFRYSNDTSTLLDASGCGNETNSDNYMFSKFMIDSTCFWAETYKLGGFRFDLMGVHDTDTMNDLADAVHMINPNAAIYGEPWTASTSGTTKTPATQSNASRWQGFGAFNDRIRESLVKTNTIGERGWATSVSGTSISSTDTSRVCDGIKGVTSDINVGANYTVNYVSCHDNYTLYDRIKQAGTTDEATIAKMSTLANAVVMTSKGTAFMQSGEEFLRTKDVDGGDPNNSYNSSYKCNELDYSRKIKYPDVYNNYKDLINIKTSTSYLHEDTSASDDVKWLGSTSGSVLEYTFTSDGYTYIVYHMNGVNSSYTASDLSGYTCVVDTLGYMSSGQTFSGSYTLNSYETIVARK